MAVPPLKHQPTGAGVTATRTREKTAERGYGGKWQRYRLGFLDENPLCAECAKANRVEVATVVDHIEPHRGNQELFWRRSNHQPLCKPCHDSKTAHGG
jgi:5-methylcytosine-specific restriction protein A